MQANWIQKQLKDDSWDMMWKGRVTRFIGQRNAESLLNKTSNSSLMSLLFQRLLNLRWSNICKQSEPTAPSGKHQTATKLPKATAQLPKTTTQLPKTMSQLPETCPRIPDGLDPPIPGTGHGLCARRAPGDYRQMNKGHQETTDR
jgi:hypothetical protein